jgi:hemolysin III
MSQGVAYSVARESRPISSETANQWTHAVGGGLSLIGAAFLLLAVGNSGDVWRILGCAIYVAALTGVYVCSTLSHAITEPQWRNRFRMLDQVCIFLLVVGTYTPFAMAYARDGWLGAMLVVMWMIALAGIAARVRAGEQSVSCLWYLPLGWMPLLAVGRILESTGIDGVALALGGGLAYTVGTWFLVNDDKHPHYHAVWHCFTVLGSLLHFCYVYQYVAVAPVA